MNGTAFLRGDGRYIDDREPLDALHLAVLRSPEAHGFIRRLDRAAAQQMAGVRLVLDASDLERWRIGPLACRAQIVASDGSAIVEPLRTVLATGRVMHVGQPIAAVVAETRHQALDAVEALELDIDALPGIVDVEAAVAADAPRLWPEAPNNQSFEWHRGDEAAVARAFDAAAHIVRLDVRHPRVAVAPMEPRGALGHYDPTSERFTLWTPSQGVVLLRQAMAECFKIGETRVRVVTDDVGGSFAVKIWPYPEHVLVLAAARATGLPVKWVASRTESFQADAPGRARVDRAALALDADGRFLAFRVDALADMGAFLNTVAPQIVTAGAVHVFGHTYRVPAMHYRVRAVFTNATPTDAYRGAGKPESAATLERLIDRAAAILGIDRFELRRQNLVPPSAMPYATATGQTYTDGDFPAVADRLRRAADLDGFGARRAASAERGSWRGLGLTFHLHGTGGSTTERSEVAALPDGTIRVRTGTQDSGQGHRMALARIAAEVLEVPVERIVVEQGDSDHLAVGGGTGGSNLMAVAGNTVYRATRAMLERARDIASRTLETAAIDLVYGEGRFRVRGTDRVLELAAIAGIEAEPGDAPGCVARLDFEGAHTTFPNGGYAAEVELDPATGAVRVVRWTGIDDLGRVIDPPSAAGQIHGAIAQSIGEVLGEALIYDTTGQLVTGSLMDYPLPRAVDVPGLETSFLPTPSANSLIGAKGVGELGSIGGVACVLNAVHDALSPAGIVHLDRPLTPERVWRAIQDHGSGETSPWP